MSAFDVLCGLALEDGRSWGAVATEWQRADAAAVLALDGPRLHFQTRPRGGSKTTDMAGVAVAMLLDQAPPRSSSYAFAVDQDQAGLLLDAAAGLIARSGLGGLLEVQTRKIVRRSSGASLIVMASDGASAFGLRPHLLLADELSQWGSGPLTRRLWEAIVSAVPKMSDCRLAVLSSAGDPSHWSGRVLDAAKGSPAWRVSEVPGPLPWRTEAELVEQRRLLTESQFARLHLNVWAAPEDRLTSRDDVMACVTPGSGALEPQPGCRYVVGFDIGIRNDWTVAAVCSKSENDEGTRVVLDVMKVWTPSRERELNFGVVEEWLVDASRSYGKAEIVFDPYSAIHLTQRLRRAGVRCNEFTFTQSSISRLALTLYRLLAEHRLDLPDDGPLIEELATVRLRESAAGLVRIDHDPDKHDDRVIALALAAHALLDAPPRRKLVFRGTA